MGKIKKNSLYDIDKKISLEWHPTKNSELTPQHITAGSSKKVWWQCEYEHEWETTPYHRTRNKSGCPYCAGQRATEENNLAIKYPTLAKEWHPTKNDSLKPCNIVPGSNKRAWWLCEKGHEWETIIVQRVKYNSGCPYCAGQRATEENNLLKKHPEIAKQWHPDKNNGLTSEDIAPASSKKVWWLCEKGHSYQQSIDKKNQRNYGCPFCSNRRIIPDENSLAAVAPEIAKEWHPTKNGELPPDELAPTSGKKVWWKCSYNPSHEWQALISNRYKLGSGCPVCANEQQSSFFEQMLFFYFKQVFKETRNRFLVCIEDKNYELDVFIPELKLGIEFDGYWHHLKERIKRDEEKNNMLRKIGIKLIRIRNFNLPKIKKFGAFIIEYEKENTYNLIFEELKKILINNFQLEQEQSEAIINLNVENIEQDKIKVYSQYVGKRKENSIANTHIELSKQWHPTRNGELMPSHCTYGSNKKVWWKCNQGHEWQAKIGDRAIKGQGCPFCAGVKVDKTNSLATLCPDISKQWDFEKNKNLSPENLTKGSGLKVWWKCNEGHEWQATVVSRTSRGYGCPFCSGRLASPSNNLAIRKPDLIKEWHSIKNGKLKIYDVLPHSSKEVWWKCNQGHEWQEVISYRAVKGRGCPFCLGSLASSDNNIKSE
ncbi:zinc-ribbon domain-containing protein [Priestia megaterium]|uniref:zinc-ribbon domain-containing protein n=1 Tax=Priestia megaterium TaxID=1404 RepID=UPI00339A9DAB